MRSVLPVLPVLPVLLALLLLPAVGCGRKVPELSISDVRLTPESRRLLADAEDEVAIAEGAWEDANAAVQRERVWRKELLDRLSDEDPTLRKAFTDLADARVEAARLAVDVADARSVLALARLERTRADSVVRHDLGLVELEPLTRDVERARERVDVAEKAAATARQEAELLADAAWTRWRTLSTDGAPPLALFVPE